MSASPLRGKRICVTGGGGFLGSFVVEELQRRGYDCLFVPRRRDYDLTTTAGVETLFADARPEVLFHLAAVVRDFRDRGGQSAAALDEQSCLAQRRRDRLELGVHYSWLRFNSR